MLPPFFFVKANNLEYKSCTIEKIFDQNLSIEKKKQINVSVTKQTREGKVRGVTLL